MNRGLREGTPVRMVLPKDAPDDAPPPLPGVWWCIAPHPTAGHWWLGPFDDDARAWAAANRDTARLLERHYRLLAVAIGATHE